MRESLLYDKREDGSVICKTCSHYCHIPEGKKGICRVRENKNGTLYVLNDRLSIASAVDPIEKKPLYHFLPGTKAYSFAAAGCNFHCPWCQNWRISQQPIRNGYAAGDEVSPEEHVRYAVGHGCASIAYTYTEPTIFLEYALDTMKLAKKKNLNNVFVSNGYMSEETLDLIIPYLDAANIDLKFFDDALHRKYLGAKLQPVLDSIQRLYDENVHLEITTMVIPGLNDDDEQLRGIASFIRDSLADDVPWHISRFFPAWKMKDKQPTPIDILKKARRIGQDIGLKNIHLGNVWEV
jgi:pyruvate formate lyase activating enzyme